MATSAVTSTTPTTSTTTTSTTPAGNTTLAQVQAQKKAAAQNILNSLSAGSGVDVNALAQNLVDAERIPRENAINAKIAKNDAKVSGISAVMFMMSEFQKALTAVKDKSSFNNLTVTNSDTNQFNVTASNTAVAGNHQIKVTSLSQPQKSVSNGLASNATLDSNLVLTLSPTSNSSANSLSINLNSGASGGTATGGNVLNAVTFGTTPTVNDFVGFSVNIGGTQRDIIPSPLTADLGGLAADLQKQLRTLDGSNDVTVTTDNVGRLTVSSASGKSITGIQLTPQTYSNNLEGLAKRINLMNQGYKAQVVNDGSVNKLVVTGAVGSDQGFSLSSTDANLSFNSPPLQEASDARLNVDGIDYTRKTNSITDILSGVTLDLRYPSPTNTPATVSFTKDTSTLKTNLTALVTAYNDLNNIIVETTNPKSKLDTYGATLVGNSSVRMIQRQVRSVFFNASSTPGATYKNLGQLGFSLDQTGVLSLDATKLDTALQSGLDDITKMFTGGYNNLSKYANLPAGIAGDAVKTLTNLLSPTGPLVTQTNNANTENTKFKDQLTQLQSRMDVLLARYQKQFAAMDDFVGSTNRQRTSLKSTFDGMMAMYTNKN